ncbi:MAG: dihydroorotate dehydrogenase electron transfer subunit [Lachnospiraceae bacterium]|jgi:dihydroorotate dehydrogenase electron transfer subunit|nr:dihydroorotate dehydrogenase electron transfer subunit [Lachnospiraceae bacterium]MEE3461278.1 dihydroorotate dehydrogenase electron transfer subunit [Lachnospiraceae bacterium]
MEKRKKLAMRVLSCSEISDGIFDLSLQVPGDKDGGKAYQETEAGQFVDCYMNDGAHLLPRPVSICGFDRENNILRLVFRVVGQGTDYMSRLKAGESLNVLGPLGNGYKLKDGVNVLLGGGVGIPPMLELSKELKAAYPDSRITAVLGYRTDDLFLAAEFEKYADVIIATDDGTAGFHGNVIDALKDSKVKPDNIYACGPLPMLRGVKSYGASVNAYTQISLEERMACGVGVCLGCVCNTTETDTHSNVKNTRVCTDGPVFEAGYVDI